MYPQNLLTALVLLAGCAAAVWFRAGFGHHAKTRRERLREVAWCSGLLLIAATLAGVFRPQPAGEWRMVAATVARRVPVASGQNGRIIYETHYQAALVRRLMFPPDAAYFTILSVTLAAAIVVVLWPALARRLVPVTLIGLGLDGLTVARSAGFYSFRTTGSYLSFLPYGQYNMQYYLILPVAYALLLTGGWLLWHGLDRGAPLTRLVLGRLAGQAAAGPPWALLLLPVALMSGALFFPGDWPDSGLAAGVSVTALLIAAALTIRRSPGLAAGLATAGLLALAAAGLLIASSWPGWAGPRTPAGYVLNGAVAVSSRPLADLAAVQALLLAGFAVWLAPRTIPQLRPLLGLASTADLMRRVQRLTESRAVAVDTAAADLRQLERDLHDGAQARLVALGMHLRAVEKLIPTSPDAALALVAEARETSARALTELRELVRGVHPPVLADRGLGDAVRALALDTPLRIETEVSLPARLPAPIETACYFAVAEVLTNAVKHSGAREARICVTHADDVLRIVVTDFGLGGADAARGSGLAGVERRLATFDGILALSSPAGGPTMVVMEVPCASSSQKISSS
jgi:signal transduction histidine kinase